MSPSSLPTQDVLHQLRTAAEHAWGDDTRHPALAGHPIPSMGQCYVTSAWLQRRLGGHVARKNGHYFWLSENGTHALDLTGDQFLSRPMDAQGSPMGVDRASRPWAPGPILLKSTDHPWFSNHEPVHVEEEDDRVRRFVSRANRALDGQETLAKVALDLAGDAYPGEEPQATQDREDRFDQPPFLHDEPGYTPQSQTYNFVYGNGMLHLSPDHSHDELARHAMIDPDSAGPFAAGFVTVNLDTANWQVRSNVALHALERIFKDYGKKVGWEWGGMTDITGQPINDDFAPKKSQRLGYVYSPEREHLWVGPGSPDLLYLSVAEDMPDEVPRLGRITIENGVAKMSGVDPEDYAMNFTVREWAQGEGLKLLSGDNVLKRVEDLETNNLWSPTDNEPEGTEFFHEPRRDERGPGGVFKCPECEQIFPSWDLYKTHRRYEEPDGDDSPTRQPELPDMDDAVPAHFTPMDYNNDSMAFMGAVVVMRTSAEQAARIAEDKSYLRDGEHWVAYANGGPVGCATTQGDNLTYIHSPVGFEVTDAILARLQCAHDDLFFSPKYIYRASGERFESPDYAEMGVLLRMGFWPAAHGVYKWSREGDASTDLEAAIPFIYDVDKDKVVVGHPGERHSDIQGHFTPAGIVEGTYEPGGKVLIRSITTMPYTVRHMLELWYYTHPELMVKSVHLRDDAGKDTKLAMTHRTKMEVGQYIANLVATDEAAWHAYQALKAAGGKVYVVGGAVRDALKGHTPKDLDLMAQGVPADAVHQALQQLPGRVDLTGKDFGVFRYRENGEEVEIALPRRERSTGAGHQDFDVQADHTMSAEEDLYRRDFTPNAMAVDLDSGRLVDPFGGAEDIAKGQFRTLNENSLSDDPLRAVRALGLNARHGFEPDAATKRQLGLHADKITHLPAERIQAELDKLFASNQPEKGIELARETGLLPYILPEVAETYGYDQQNPHHEQELYDHMLSVLAGVKRQGGDPDLALTGLLHDIGKPASRWTECRNCPAAPGKRNALPPMVTDCPTCGLPGSGHYYEFHQSDPESGQENVYGAAHERVGADMAERRLRALKYPEARIARIKALIDGHMYNPVTSERGARRFLNRYGDHADDLLLLRQADQGGKSAYPVGDGDIDRERALLEAVRAKGEATNQSQLAVNGHDILALGIRPGPQVGAILRHLTEAVLDDPSLNQRDTLLRIADDYQAA